MTRKKKKKKLLFIEVIEGKTKSKEAKKSMDDILNKLKNAKKKVKKIEDMGF